MVNETPPALRDRRRAQFETVADALRRAGAGSMIRLSIAPEFQ
jgi:hypothetical protein